MVDYPDPLIDAFDHAIIVRRVERPDRSFVFHVTFQVEHPLLVALAAKKPPLHFHPHQDEYMEVLKGSLRVDLEDEEMILTPDDGEVKVKAWVNHRLYADSPEPVPGKKPNLDNQIQFLVSGDHSSEAFQLDTMFFQNWYGYQNEIVMGGKDFDFIQIMSMFDAGGSYLTLPWWIPFRGRVSQGLGIVVGRWIGGLLGYSPFYRKWTTDWTLASDKMKTSFFQRRFVGHFKAD